MGMFVKNVDAAYRMRIFLERFSINSAVLNQELPHASRQNIIQAFNQSLVELLIATDAGVGDVLDDDDVESEKKDAEGEKAQGKENDQQEEREREEDQKE